MDEAYLQKLTKKRFDKLSPQQQADILQTHSVADLNALLSGTISNPLELLNEITHQLNETGHLRRGDLKISELNLRAAQHPVTTANLLRQHAGINPFDNQGNVLGSNLLNPRAKKKEELSYWLSARDAKDANLPTLETSYDELISSAGLVGIESKVRLMIQEFISQSAGTRRKLFEIIQESRTGSLAESIYLSLAKIKILLTINELSQSSRNLLGQIQEFYQTEVIPFVNLDGNEMRVVNEKVAQYLAKPNPNKDETYEQKARRILIARQNIKGGAYSRESSETVFSAVAEESIMQLPTESNVQMMKTAMSLNHIQLLELLEENGIDITSTREDIQRILKSIPFDSYKFREVIIRITDRISKLFPHDTIYMLSQILVFKQASCVGKSVMAGLVLKDLGVDVKFSEADGHEYCSIPLPDNTRLILDLNWEGIPHHSTIIRPSGVIIEDPETVRIRLRNQRYSNLVYIRTDKGFEQYTSDEVTTSIFADSPRDSVEYNLCSTIINDPHLFIDEYGGDMKALLKEVKRMIDLLRKLSPQDSGVYVLYAELLSLMIKEGIIDENKKGAFLKKTQELLLIALEKNPLHIKAYLMLIELYKDNTDVFFDEFGGEDAIRNEIHGYYVTILEIDNENIDAHEGLIKILSLNKELFILKYLDIAGVENKIIELKIQLRELYLCRLEDEDDPNLCSSTLHSLRDLLVLNRDVFESYYGGQAGLEQEIERIDGEIILSGENE